MELDDYLREPTEQEIINSFEDIGPYISGFSRLEFRPRIPIMSYIQTLMTAKTARDQREKPNGPTYEETPSNK